MLGAKEFARLHVFIVHMTVQMCLGAKPHGAARMYALMGPVVVTLVVAS